LIGTRTNPRQVSGFRLRPSGLWLLISGFHFGGVLDSTLGWSAPLPFEDEGWPRKSSFKKIIGNYESMPLAA
jgi:hypothetical protein